MGNYTSVFKRTKTAKALLLTAIITLAIVSLPIHVGAEAEAVTVHVYGPGSTPVSGANVILYDHETGEWVNDTVTDDSGAVSMTVDDLVVFDVLVYKTGYGSLSGGRVLGYLFDDNATFGYSSPCELVFSLESVSHGTLSGTVKNATDETALEGATVSILAYIRGTSYFVNSTTTSSDGSYSIDLNAGLWKVWIDKKVSGNVTHLGTWTEVQMTGGISTGWNVSLWPKAQLSIVDMSAPLTYYGPYGYPTEQHGDVMLINDTYGGILWRDEVDSDDIPATYDIPAVQGLLVVTTKASMYGLLPKTGEEQKYVYSTTINASKGSTVTLNVTLSEQQYQMWSFPSDWENEKLLGNLTWVTMIVASGSQPGGAGGPPQFLDPDGTLYQYLMLDRGLGIPTTWQTKAVPTRTEIGWFYHFFDLNTLNAPQGYYISMMLIKNATGHAVVAEPNWFNRFQYQVQPLQLKGTYNCGEDVDARFKVYGASGYVNTTDVIYALFNDTWDVESEGYATVDSTTKVWNVTFPSTMFPIDTITPVRYHLMIKVIGGREFRHDFAVDNYTLTRVRFAGHILPNAVIDLWSETYGPTTISADETGLFNVTLPQGWYGAWFHYDNKETPGMDARDTSINLDLMSNITDFPNYSWEYLGRPLQAAFEVRGITFTDTNENGIWDEGEPRLAYVNVRATNMSGWDEWIPPSFPDGSFRFCLRSGQIYRLRATKTIYRQNETATPEVGAGTSQGDLSIVNIPMIERLPGNLTGYVMLDNGTFLENAGLHFMDQYWSWIGSTFTNSTGGYLFTAPAGEKMNVWVDPGPSAQGLEGREVRGVVVTANETLYLNITIYRTTRVNGTLLVNGTGAWATILPLDENWNRVVWDRGTGYDGYFDFTVPISAKKLLITAGGPQGNGFLVKDVDLQEGVTNNLGILNLTETDQYLQLNTYAKNWAYEWFVGQRVDFNAELRNSSMWQNVEGANITFWAWYWDNGTLVKQGTMSETSVSGLYQGNFTPSYTGHYKIFVVANVSAGTPHIKFNDFWISTTDKKLYLIEGRGEYALSAVQDGTAKVRLKLLSTTDGSPIAGYPVWYEIRKFMDVQSWWMENVVPRTRATNVGNGIYEITIPAILTNGSYWMEMMAGDWETSQRLGFEISVEPVPTVKIYGWITRSPTPVEGAIVEAWMEGRPYLYVTSTNASGYYSLSVPQKNAYHLHIYDDNCSTPGVDYTTIPEWNRIQVMVIDVLNNATVARLGEASLTIMRQGEPCQVDVLVWDNSTAPSGALAQLIMWSGTWRGPGLFNEKLKEGSYTFEVGVFWPPSGPWHHWWNSPYISADQPLVSQIEAPVYDTIVQAGVDMSGTWRVSPGDNVTMRIWERDMTVMSVQVPMPGNETQPGMPQQPQIPTLQGIFNSSEKRFEVFHWVPGRMAEGFAYNVAWVLKNDTEQGVYLEANFTIPAYFTGGDYGMFAFLYNTTAQQKVFMKVETHLMIAELDADLSVVPYTASQNGTVMFAVLLMAQGVPASGATVAFEIYDARWQLADIVTGTELAPGIYVGTFQVPDEYIEFGWWTVKAIATVRGKETVMYQGFNVQPKAGSESQPKPMP